MTIIALVGPSGSGKSHRASMVADRYAADAILDDGLLIVEGRIVAGHSAKREVTRMAAVKRAILLDPTHADHVRQALIASGARRLLVLATSRNMIGKILDALKLAYDELTWVNIEEVATPAEIETAKRERSVEGKHVIPAPTLEVRKTFSGYLVAPLQFIFYHHGRGHRVTVEKSIVRPTYSLLGRFYIADTVLAAISAHAARDCSGVQSVARVVVHADAQGIRFDVDLILASQIDLYRVMTHVQDRVRQWVEALTSLTVVEVSVSARHLAWSEMGENGG